MQDFEVTRVPAEEYSKYMCNYQVEHPETTLFNLSMLYEIPYDIDVKRLKKAFEDVCQAHPMLLSVFAKTNNGWDIVYSPNKANSVEIIDVDKLDTTSLKKPFTPGECVYRCKIICEKEHKYLFMDFSHAAVDGTSQKVLHKELSRAYFGEKLEKDHYFEQRLELEAIKNTEKYLEDKAFFEEKYGNNEYSRFPRPDFDENGESIVCEFKVPEGVDYRNSTSLKAALYAMAEYNDCDKVIATWTYHSRDTMAKKESIGLFIRDIPIGITIGDDIRKSIAEGRSHRDYQWSLTNDEVVLYTTFQGKLNTFEGIPGIECKNMVIPKNSIVLADSPMDIEFKEDDKGRRFTIRYDSGMYRPESIEKYGKMVQSWYKKSDIN